MKLPCEYAMWYVLPHIRAELARTLVKKGVSRKETAEKLGISAAAVSQYLHKKRGDKTEISAEDKKMIEKAAEEIKNTVKEDKVLELICQCCTKVRTNGK